MMWKRQKRKIDQYNFQNFDDFIFGEIYDFLRKVQPLMNSSNTTVETLASVDSMIIGMRHAFNGEQSGESCPCCKYWCSGANCPIVEDAWYMFLKTLPDLKSIINHA